MPKKTARNAYQQPLAEVFGFPVNNYSKEAQRYRLNRLCPFNNRVPSCTKDKAKDPLGVCSIFHEKRPVITCPVRFRQDWLIVEQAAKFFFRPSALWTSLGEVRLEDGDGKCAGNIDIVLVEYDSRGKVTDFGSVEIQAVYISGNIRTPFGEYISKSTKTKNFVWTNKPNYPKPDYLSSSRKRLVPQILYKGGILKSWGKKQAIILQKSFFKTLPEMPRVNDRQADIAWFLYDLAENKGKYQLICKDIIYTKFEPAINKIVNPQAGDVQDFVEVLQEKLDEKLEGSPPDAPILSDTILS